MKPEYRKLLEDAYSIIPDNRYLCPSGCNTCCHDIKLTPAEYLFIIENGGNAEPGNGRCEFLDSRGGCNVYNLRPWICRIYVPKNGKLSDDEGCGFCAVDGSVKRSALMIRQTNRMMGLDPRFVPLTDLIKRTRR